MLTTILAFLTPLGPVIGVLASGLSVFVTWWQRKNTIEPLQSRLDDIARNYNAIENKIRAANAAGDYAAADGYLNELRALHGADSEHLDNPAR